MAKRRNETKLLRELRELSQDAYNEQALSGHKRSALAFLALERVVRGVARMNPGWGGNLGPLTHSAIKVH